MQKLFLILRIMSLIMMVVASATQWSAAISNGVNQLSSLYFCGAMGIKQRKLFL